MWAREEVFNKNKFDFALDAIYYENGPAKYFVHKVHKKNSVEQMALRLQYHVYTSPHCSYVGDVAAFTRFSFTSDHKV
jgi:hypothetical protein